MEWCPLGEFGSAGVHGNNKAYLYPERVDAICVIAPWVIWKVRCRSVFDGTILTLVGVAQQFHEYLALQINLQYRRAQTDSTLERFHCVRGESDPLLLVREGNGIWCYLWTSLGNSNCSNLLYSSTIILQ